MPRWKSRLLKPDNESREFLKGSIGVNCSELRLENQGKRQARKGVKREERGKRNLGVGRRSIRLGKLDKEGGDIRR
jgi:hypothetical protein